MTVLILLTLQTRSARLLPFVGCYLDLKEGRKEMFYLTTHSTHFIYGYMASDIWLRTILIVRQETRCRHMGYSFRLTARVLLYAPSHRQDRTQHGLCYTSRGALAGTRNSVWWRPHERFLVTNAKTGDRSRIYQLFDTQGLPVLDGLYQ